ncbi:hypothetical protein J6590_001064 [Homalodisca vitripennis]|nr:hypothetical protein J6590_001064 [Homalodisca vitripennis]
MTRSAISLLTDMYDTRICTTPRGDDLCIIISRNGGQLQSLLLTESGSVSCNVKTYIFILPKTVSVGIRIGWSPEKSEGALRVQVTYPGHPPLYKNHHKGSSRSIGITSWVLRGTFIRSPEISAGALRLQVTCPAYPPRAVVCIFRIDQYWSVKTRELVVRKRPSGGAVWRCVCFCRTNGRMTIILPTFHVIVYLRGIRSEMVQEETIAKSRSTVGEGWTKRKNSPGKCGTGL